MRLFTPKWQSTDPQKRLQGVEKVTDQGILFDLVFDHHSDTQVRLKCVSKIQDQAMLCEIAIRNAPEITRAAFGKLHIKALIQEVAQNAGEWSVRKEAWIKLGETQLAMAEEATNTPKFHRMVAVEKIHSPYLLCQVAIAQETDAYYQVYGYAIDQIGDQKLLSEVVLHAACKGAALQALEHITDQSLLSDIAQNKQIREFARIVAIEKIYDKHLLLRLTGEALPIKSAAIRRLEEL